MAATVNDDRPLWVASCQQHETAVGHKEAVDRIAKIVHNAVSVLLRVRKYGAISHDRCHNRRFARDSD